QPFAHPLVLSKGIINAVTQADAVVRVRVNGRETEGRGCIYLSDLWAWPDLRLSHENRDVAMRGYCERLAHRLPQLLAEASHPLSLGLRLPEQAVADEENKFDPHPPLLARAISASIFAAAIHDGP